MSELQGVWALMTLVDGTNVVGRLKGAKSDEEFLSLDDGWVDVEEACTYHVQMAQVQGGGQAIFAMCIPYAASPDELVSVKLRVSNIASFCSIARMPEKMRRMVTSKIKEAKQTALRLAAASAGISIR